MTIELFLTLVTVLSAVTSLFTEVVKKFCEGLDVEYSANVIAGVCAVCVGLIGTTTSYIFLGIEFSTGNVVCVFLMAVVIWIGAMTGYDKVKQLINQISELKVGD
ncbi:MAG: hypothetical protein LIO87_03130 [Eubacterium sp.]|nr:hypothetical protein [Eubacterium sp.]